MSIKDSDVIGVISVSVIVYVLHTYLDVRTVSGFREGTRVQKPQYCHRVDELCFDTICIIDRD